MSKALGFCLSVALLACLSARVNAEGALPVRGKIRVAALAADVQSVVFVNDRGQPRRYAVGAVIAGSDWQVAHVASDYVTLESSKRFGGSRLTMRLASDQSADLAEAEATLLALHRPVISPRFVSTRASKRSSVPQH